MARKALPTSRRAAIWHAHDHRCIYCTEFVTFADLDIDHVIPSYLKEQPEELAKLLDEYGLDNEFDVDSLLNLVPSHRHCNLQKKSQILPKSRAIHFLSIAESKFNKACKIELEIKEQIQKDKFMILLQVALDEGRISRDELNSLIVGYSGSQNMFEVLTALPFVDSELKGFISSTDIDSLYDRPILPRFQGLDYLTMARGTWSDEESIKVYTCREWVEAIRDGYHARSTYDIKEETFFKNVYSLVVALAQAKVPRKRFISDLNASISNFNLLPVTLLPDLSGDRELKRLQAEGVGISDLITQGEIKIISSSPLTLTLHYGYMGLYLYEILRADLNDDGIEDLLIGSYMWALEGTFGAGSTMVLTLLGLDQPFTVAENIKLNVKED